MIFQNNSITRNSYNYINQMNNKLIFQPDMKVYNKNYNNNLIIKKMKMI